MATFIHYNKKCLKVLNRHTKWQCKKLPVKVLHSAICYQKNFPREYFLAADRGDVYLIKGHKNLKSFSFASHSKVVHSEDHFSEEGLFRSRFSKSSFKFKWESGQSLKHGDPVGNQRIVGLFSIISFWINCVFELTSNVLYPLGLLLALLICFS